MDYSLVYATGAVWLSVLLVYYLLSRRPLYAMPVGGLAVALAFIVLYPWVMGWANDKAFRDLAVFEQSRQCILDTVGTAAAHVSFATDVITTAGAVLGLFTLGISTAVASIIADAIISAFASLVHAIVVYLSYAESILGTAVAAVNLAPSFAALAAPLLATLMPDRRGAAVAAAVASAPVVLGAAFLLTPPLTPYDACHTGKTNMALNSAVYAKADGPITLVFEGISYGGWNVTIVYSPVVEGKLYIPAGNYTAYAIWSFIPIPLGEVRAPPREATVANVTIANRTASLPDIPSTANLTISITRYVDEWTFASDKRPDRQSYEGIYKTYTYVINYSCYGTSAECPGFSLVYSALGQIVRVVIRVYESQNLRYSTDTSVTNATAISEELWEQICHIGEVPFGYCPGYRQPTRGEAVVSITPVVEYECTYYVNGTCQQYEERRLERRFRAEVVFYAWPLSAPRLAGILHDGERTYDWVAGLLALAFPPFGLAGAIAKYFGGMIAWLTTALIPYLLSLIYAEIAVVLGIGGVLALIGAGNVFWQWLHVNLIAKMRWGFDPIRTPLRLIRTTARYMGRGESPLTSVTVQTTKEVVKEVVKEPVKKASMAWFGVAAAVRGWEMFYYGEPWLWPAYGAQAAALYRHLRSTDFTLTRREALARSLFYTLTPAGHEYARRLDAYIYWLQNIAYLRIDAFAALGAKRIYEAYQANLELVGSRSLAAELTLYYKRPVLATEAAYYVLAINPRDRLEGRYFAPLVERLAEMLPGRPPAEEVARRWMALYGYDYDRLKTALERLGIEASPQTVVFLPLMEQSEYIARMLVERGEYGLAATFRWTAAVREFEARYAPLEALARGDEAAWRRYVLGVAREEWEPLRSEPPRPSELLETAEALRWLADKLVLRGGEALIDHVGLIQLDKAALVFPEVREKVLQLTEGIIPEEVALKALSKPETALAIFWLAQEERDIERLADLYARRAEPWELVEEAGRLQRMGHYDLARRLGDAAELAAAARVAEVLPFEPSVDVMDLARAMALGLSEEKARYVLERYGSQAVEWLEDARIEPEPEEPSLLVDHLKFSYLDKTLMDKAANELEEILGWRPSEEQLKQIRDFYLSVEDPAFLQRVKREEEEKATEGAVDAVQTVDAVAETARAEMEAAAKSAEELDRALWEKKAEEAWERWGDFGREYVERVGPGGVEILERAERLQRVAARFGDSLPLEDAVRYVEEHGPSALNAWAEDYAAERWGEWAREYVAERGVKALDTLQHYEAAEEKARQIGVEMDRDALLKIAERWGEEAPDRVVEIAAERLAREYGLRGIEADIARDLEAYGLEAVKSKIEEAIRRAKESGEDPRDVYKSL